jgi:hypothetical protein
VLLALAEEVTQRRTTPWLRTRGPVVAGVLFGPGAVGPTAASYAAESVPRAVAP